jgi:hypothetical protein
MNKMQSAKFAKYANLAKLNFLGILNRLHTLHGLLFVRMLSVMYRSDYGFRMKSYPVMVKKFVQLAKFGNLGSFKDIV